MRNISNARRLLSSSGKNTAPTSNCDRPGRVRRGRVQQTRIGQLRASLPKVARTDAVRPTSRANGDVNARPPTLSSCSWMGHVAGIASQDTPEIFARKDRRRSGAVFAIASDLSPCVRPQTRHDEPVDFVLGLSGNRKEFQPNLISRGLSRP